MFSPYITPPTLLCKLLSEVDEADLVDVLVLDLPLSTARGLIGTKTRNGILLVGEKHLHRSIFGIQMHLIFHLFHSDMHGETSNIIIYTYTSTHNSSHQSLSHTRASFWQPYKYMLDILSYPLDKTLYTIRKIVL